MVNVFYPRNNDKLLLESWFEMTIIEMKTTSVFS